MGLVWGASSWARSGPKIREAGAPHGAKPAPDVLVREAPLLALEVRDQTLVELRRRTRESALVPALPAAGSSIPIALHVMEGGRSPTARAVAKSMTMFKRHLQM